ncbi:MAG: hypothetical protein AAF322_21635, partial [Pseudomonadota bacterium]
MARDEVPPEVDPGKVGAAAIGRALRDAGGGAAALAEALLDRIAAQTSPVFLTATRERALAEAAAAD